MSNYLKVDWMHDLTDEPVVLCSEIADSGAETRKVEVYRDGRHDYADDSVATGSTMLSEAPFPSVDEIAAQPEFSVETISRGRLPNSGGSSDRRWGRVTVVVDRATGQAVAQNNEGKGDELLSLSKV